MSPTLMVRQIVNLFMLPIKAKQTATLLLDLLEVHREFILPCQKQRYIFYFYFQNKITLYAQKCYYKYFVFFRSLYKCTENTNTIITNKNNFSAFMSLLQTNEVKNKQVRQISNKRSMI